jgi:hypothetical protein
MMYRTITDSWDLAFPPFYVHGGISLSWYWFSASHRPVATTIQEDRKKSEPRLLGVSTAIPTPPHDFMWRSQNGIGKTMGDGRRTRRRKEPKRQSKDVVERKTKKKKERLERR